MLRGKEYKDNNGNVIITAEDDKEVQEELIKMDAQELGEDTYKRKRGRKPANMTKEEWEYFYLNKSIRQLITELVEIKTGGLVTLRREEYEELLKYKREVNVMKQKFESFTNSFLNNSLFSTENEQSLGEFMSEEK
jgi:hypothetical protein